MVKKNPVLKTKILKMSPPPHTVPLTTRACYTQLNTHHNQDYILLLAYCIFLDPLMLSLTASSIQILTHCCQRHVQTHGCPVAPPVHKKTQLRQILFGFHAILFLARHLWLLLLSCVWLFTYHLAITGHGLLKQSLLLLLPTCNFWHTWAIH